MTPQNVSQFDLPAEPAAAGTAAAAKPGRVAGAMAAAAVATDAKARGGLDGPLEPMTQAQGEGKLKKAMRSIKGRLTAPSVRDAKARLGKAAKATRRLLVTGNYVGEIIVAGERVRLNEEGFNPEKFYDVVSFHDKFFPHSDITNMDEQKTVFSRVFGDGAPVDPGTGAPALPCSGAEADILLEGLKTRFEGLRDETVKVYEMVGDTADVRARIDHLQRLKIFIDALERAERHGTCVDFQNLATVTEKDVRTEEEIRALLRQFAFMILQARAPVPEYSDRTRIVQDFIAELQRDPVSEEEMNAYLVLWKEQAAARGKPEELPTILGEVLETTATQRGLLDIMLEDKLEALYTRIVEAVRADYQVDAGVLEKFNRLILERISSREADLSPQAKVIEVVKIVVGINKDCWEQLKKGEAQIVSLTSEKERLQRDLDEAERQIVDFANKEAAAAAEKEAFTKQIAGLTGEVEGLRAELGAQKAAAEQAAASAAAEIQNQRLQITNISGLLAAANNSLQSAEADRAKAEETAIAAAQAQEAMAAQLAEEQRQHEELQTRHKALEEKMAILQATVQKHDEKMTATRAELEKAKAEVERLNAGAGLSEKEAAAKAGEIAKLTEQIRGLEEAAGGQNAEKSRLQAELDACREELQRQLYNLSTLKEDGRLRSEAAAKEVGQAKAAAAGAVAAAVGARRQAAAAEQQMEGLRQRIGQLEEEVVRARETLAAASAEVARLQAEAAKGSAEAAAQVQNALAHRVAAEEQLKTVEADCKEAKAAAAAALADRDRQIADLQEKLTRANAKEAEQAAAVAAAEAAAAKKADELEVAKAAAASGVAAASEEGRAAAERLSAELEQLRAAVAAAKTEAAAAATEKEVCQEALTAAEKAAAAAVGRETAMQGRMVLLERETIESLRQLAESVLSDDPKLPAIKTEGLAKPFQSLLDNIQRANAKAAEAGKAAGAASSIAPATQICFMTHFITFFVKTLFFTHDMEEERYALSQTLDTYVSSALSAYKAAHPEETDDRHILFKMLSAAFSLLHAGETLYMNKQAVRGEFAAKDFVGLQVLKSNGPSGEPDTGRAEMVELLYSTWAAVPSLTDVKEDLNKAVQTVFGQILILPPTVSYNPPIKEKEGVTTPLLQLLHEYPSLTFLAGEVAQSATSNQTFTEVDMDNGFVMRKHNILGELPAGAIAARAAWPEAVRNVMNDNTLSFADLFCIFIALGRRYLISLKDDLSRLKCPLPVFLESPEAARAALQEDGSKARQQQRRAWEEDAAAAAARKAAEEAERQRKAAEEAERERKAAEEAEAERQRKAAEEAEAAAKSGGKNLERPTKSNPHTFALIFKQLKAGRSAKFKEVLQADLQQFAETSSFPIKTFIQKYITSSDYFKQEPGAGTESPKQKAEGYDWADFMRRWMTSVVNYGRGKKKPLEFYRMFMMHFIDNYTKQYRVDNAETPEAKIDAIFDDFKASFNISYPNPIIKGKTTTLFEQIGLTDSSGALKPDVKEIFVDEGDFEVKYSKKYALDPLTTTY
jgi:DNA repair exonuclease SbcCD ATPase subunit